MVPTSAPVDRLNTIGALAQRDPRAVYHDFFQDMAGHMSVVVDTHFAGCRATRRSTSGGVALRAGHRVRNRGPTQPRRR